MDISKLKERTEAIIGSKIMVALTLSNIGDHHFSDADVDYEVYFYSGSNTSQNVHFAKNQLTPVRDEPTEATDVYIAVLDTSLLPKGLLSAEAKVTYPNDNIQGGTLTDILSISTKTNLLEGKMTWQQGEQAV